MPLLIPALAPLLAASCLLPPVNAPVTDAFREPSCTWCPGNRGLEYTVPAGAAVRAAAAGRVTFRGSVAGVLYVVVEHADGLRATYGRLSSTDLSTGSTVTQGSEVGRSSSELYFGLRRGDMYVDPAPLLGRLVERWRLVPTDGSLGRRAPPPRLRCPASLREVG